MERRRSYKNAIQSHIKRVINSIKLDFYITTLLSVYFIFAFALQIPHHTICFYLSGWTLSTICLNTSWAGTNRTLWRAASNTDGPQSAPSLRWVANKKCVYFKVFLNCSLAVLNAAADWSVFGKVAQVCRNHQKLFISSSGSFATGAQILVREAVKERVIIGRIALGATAETFVN